MLLTILIYYWYCKINLKKLLIFQFTICYSNFQYILNDIYVEYIRISKKYIDKTTIIVSH